MREEASAVCADVNICDREHPTIVLPADDRNARPEAGLNRTGFIGEPIPREDGSDAPTQQVLPRAA
jgi:hypothetical protein